MADDEIDGCTDNDAELEIQSQATSTFDDATHLEVGRRTSLDRSYTMPAPSWEEGDQILKEYRLRKAAREAARMNRSSEGGVWGTPRRTASGSAPPSVLQESDAGRSPSRNTVSSTISLRKQAVTHDSNIAPLVEEDDLATIPPRPSSSSGSFTSSQIFRPPPLTRPSSLRNASAAVSENAPHRDTLDDTSPTTSRRVSTASKTKRRPSSVRATSDGPLASRRSSSRLPPEDVQTMHSRSGSQIKGTRVPSTHTTSATDETETSSSRPSSIIDHGEVIESDTPSAASLADELRGHSIPVYDYTAYGIPKTVILGGKQVDISDMGILEQVEMLRRAQQEARDSKNRTSSGDTLAGKPLEPLDFYQNMPSTDLSVIAERTECSTVSRRTTIAPTDGTESARSYSVPAFGRHLAPTHTRSRLSLSTTKSSLSSDSISPSEGGKDMTEAERIRHRFMRKTANKADVEQPTAPQSGKATPAYTPGHRKYTSVGDTKYHTLPLSPTSSASVSLHNSASSIAVPALAKPATKTASSARLAASGLKPLNNSQKLSLGFPDPLKTASSGESPYMTSKGTSSAASGRPSPSKHAFSPTIAQKIEALRKAPSLAQEDYNTSPISRKRSKSLHSDDRSSRSRIFGDSSDGAAMPPLPKALGLPPSKSTSALVQMFESKASAVPVPEANRTSFPVKEWLKKVDLQKVPPSPGIYPPTPPSISSASGSVVDYNAYKRRRDKEDAANAAGLSASTGRAQQRRRRSQSLTALPEVVVSREAQPPLLPSSTTVSSFEDSAVVYHGNLYWLDSSSTARPPFWQACRAVITTQEELRISWLGPRSGGMHERFFDLRSCTAAHSIRRPPHITTTSVQAYDPESLPPTQDELSRLQVFELVWPGRTQRFACPSLATRIKWLSHIFEVIVRYSNTSTPLSEQEAAPVEERSLGSVTLRSMDLPRPSLTSRPSDSASEVSNLEKVPIRQLAKETQDSLYASVSEMLSGASASRKASDLPDIPRYQLKDVPSRDVEESRTPHTPMSVTPRPSRGAWSDADRVSTQSDPVSGAPPAARSVARDLKRILTLMSKTRSTSASSDIGNGFPDQMKEMQSHLERLSQDIRHTSVAARHSRHAPEMVSKMDELLALCKRMAEEKPKAPLYAQEVSEAKSGELELIADAVKKAEPEERQAGLVRLEEKMETLLEVVNRLAAAESPTAQKRSKSPDQSPELPKTTSYITSASNPSAAPIPAVHPAHYATAQALQLLPSTPSLMGELGMDFDQDLEQWQKYDKKRNSALPPLPPFGGPNVKQKSRGDAVANLQSASERAAMTDFYKNLGRKAEPSSRPSSIVSSNRVRNARSDAAMRLEGSHPGLLATQSQSTRTIDKRQPISKWSADTPLLDPASRRPSAKANVNVASRPKKIQQVAVQAVLESDDGDTSPPTPKQRGFPKQDAIKSETALPSVTVVDNKTQEAILIQLNSMQGLLETLVAAQNKQSEALKHQEDVSVYIKHLQEYLAEDRVHRKEEFAAIKASLTSISQQLSGLPKEIQTLVEASLAVAVLQKPTAADAASTVEPTPAPAPDTDSPNTDVAVVAAKQVPQVESGQPIKTAAEAPQSQGKKSGTSLFRKVSLGLAGMASVGAGNAGGRVGGPRKMGAGRLFGNPQPGGTAPDARDRWNPNRYKPVNGTTGDLPQADVPEQDPTVSQVVDPQAPLMAALAGFEKQISDESGDNEDGATIIALGILEVLKMLKEQEAREHEREHYRREEALLRSDEERERHAAELDAVRAELREWEAKREELAAAQIKDETSEGIDTIIALLKDQMAHQEEALVNLRDTLSPQIRDIGAESEEAILAMREEMSKSLADFKTQLDEEVKKTLDEVGVLRDQKKQLQSDLSDLLAFKSKYGGGAPETLQKPQPSMAPQHTSQRMPIHPIRPTARQAYPQAYPPPRPDTSMSAGGQQYHWGLKGPR